MSVPQRVALFAGATFVAFLFFLLLKVTYAAVHGRPASVAAGGKKRIS